MPRYNVAIREIHISHREVVADSPEEAKQRALDDVGSETSLEYSRTMDSEYITVEEIEETPEQGA